MPITTSTMPAATSLRIVFGFFRRLKSGEQGDAGRKRRKPFGKVIIMLMRQERRGDEHRHLAIIFHSFKCRPHGHLRLAVAHVAADQPVHRFAGFHVARDILDRFQLIRRFFILKGGFEFVIQGAVEPIGSAVCTSSRLA